METRRRIRAGMPDQTGAVAKGTSSDPERPTMPSEGCRRDGGSRRSRAAVRGPGRAPGLRLAPRPRRSGDGPARGGGRDRRTAAGPPAGRGIRAGRGAVRRPGDAGRRPDATATATSGSCLDELAAFGRLRAELERRRAAGPGGGGVPGRAHNPSNNPDPAVDPGQRRLAAGAGCGRRRRTRSRTTRSCPA